MQEQASGFDSSIPCLCCDKVVLIRSQDWGPKCVGLCMGCYRSHTNETIRLIYFLRCQLAALRAQIEAAQTGITSLFKTVKELDEAVFEPA